MVNGETAKPQNHAQVQVMGETPKTKDAECPVKKLCTESGEENCTCASKLKENEVT